MEKRTPPKYALSRRSQGLSWLQSLRAKLETGKAPCSVLSHFSHFYSVAPYQSPGSDLQGKKIRPKPGEK